MIVNPNEIINPNNFKYSIQKGRWKTTCKINRKSWFRSHLFYAFHHHIPLNIFQSLLNSKMIIHHQDKNPLNDDFLNLKLLSISQHLSIHFKGKPSSRKGKYLSQETKQKMSETHVGKFHSQQTKQKLSDKNKGDKHPQYKYSISNDVIINLIFNQHFSLRKVAIILKTDHKTISKRLHLLGYYNYSNNHKSDWRLLDSKI